MENLETNNRKKRAIKKQQRRKTRRIEKIEFRKLSKKVLFGELID